MTYEGPGLGIGGSSFTGRSIEQYFLQSYSYCTTVVIMKCLAFVFVLVDF